MEILGLLQHRDVTGADISPSGDVLALACYDDGWSYRYAKKHSLGCNSLFPRFQIHATVSSSFLYLQQA